MPRTLISLGANLGNVRESMGAAKRLLIDSFGASNCLFSQLYRTPPVGGPSGQDDFLNAVVAIETDQSVWEIWKAIQSIESALGRQRQHRWEARRIDVDLLLYDQQRIWTPHLKVPHPRMCMRTFVITPAFEIVPDWIEPVTNWSVAKLHNHLLQSRHNPSVIDVLCQGTSQRTNLQQGFESWKTDYATSVAWKIATPERIAQNRMDGMGSSAAIVKLTIAAVASPDPTTILWEDCSKPWVKALNMDTCSEIDPHEPRAIHGPRYLMPADDTKWAVHEIIAASQAMQCALQAVGIF